MVTYNGITFTTVLNSDTDLGLTAGATEMNGDNCISAIEANYGSDTLIEFEPGHYTIDSTWYDFDTTVDSFGIRGLGDHHRDVVFDIPDTSLNNVVGLKLSDDSGGTKTNHLFRNFSINITENGDRHYRMYFAMDDGLVIQDLEYLGTHPIPALASLPSSETPMMTIDVLTTDGVATVRRFHAGLSAPQPYEPVYPGAGGSGNGILGLNNGGSHVGETRIEDWRIENLTNEAMRLSNSANAGIHTIRGGRFRNNQKVNIRTSSGNHATKVTTVHNATVIQDGDGPVVDPQSGQGTQPINIDNNGNTQHGIIFRNLNLYVDSWQRSPCIDIPGSGDHGEAFFYDCNVENATTLTTLSAGSVTTTPDAIHIIGGNWIETGSGGGMDISDRTNSEITDACVTMNGTIDVDFTQTNVTSSGCGGAVLFGYGSVGRTEDGIVETTNGLARCR